MTAASIEIEASAADVHHAWRQVELWPLWDPEVLAVSLPDGLVAGAKGWLQPRGGPRALITVTRSGVDSFDVESRLPLCRMVFGHCLEATAGGTRVTHDVKFFGLSAPLFRQIIGRQIAAALPATLAGLKRHVETGETILAA